MPTTTELARRVMKRMGILDPAENPTSQESDDVVAIMNSVYSSMKERKHINWTLTSIPTRYQDAFISVVAYKAAPDFGVLTQELAIKGREGEKEIYALNEKPMDPRHSPVVDY
jgi:hypothetical protein